MTNGHNYCGHLVAWLQILNAAMNLKVHALYLILEFPELVVQYGIVFHAM